ncbi:unnamed protein product [Arctia plantaginis]|uniref:Uncharacterized protein n=1 Tax=Arctia plantaginis TaxID=874455 RepID=A0A8S1AAG0_ARCPL|nr:unnamed protein product [Arctia plantaginis]
MQKNTGALAVDKALSKLDMMMPSPNIGALANHSMSQPTTSSINNSQTRKHDKNKQHSQKSANKPKSSTSQLTYKQQSGKQKSSPSQPQYKRQSFTSKHQEPSTSHQSRKELSTSNSSQKRSSSSHQSLHKPKEFPIIEATASSSITQTLETSKVMERINSMHKMLTGLLNKQAPKARTRPDCLPFKTTADILEFNYATDEDYTAFVDYLSYLGGVNATDAEAKYFKSCIDIDEDIFHNVTWSSSSKERPGMVALKIPISRKLAKMQCLRISSPS